MDARRYPRAPSRSSTASRRTPLSASSSASQVGGRARNASPPPLSRQQSSDSARHIAHSSFLQERLQRERRIESDKLTTSSTKSQSNTDMSSAAEACSPHKAPASDSTRPQSSAGAEHGKRKGLGLKEMEQVVSGLHKQNFDLKLELYHRRERQSALEERLDALEADKQHMEDVNERLTVELEKRDKAVEEAVAMIVNLESEVDQLIRERRMVQMIEEQYLGRQTPRPHGEDEADKTINRMPSFVSERSATTENLRNVYLDARASVVSMPRVNESPDARLGSPTLSELSESSFVSVYGRGQDDPDATLVAAEPESPPVNGQMLPHRQPEPARQTTNPRRQAATNLQTSPKRPAARAVSAGQIMQVGRSPLQRIEKLEGREHVDIKTRIIATDVTGAKGLPPTPDTVSSDTLRKAQEHRPAPVLDHRPQADIPLLTGPRPRSAGESVVSRRGDWGSDDEDDDDARSLESSLDIWMRESAKPSRYGGRISPDLFGFPSAGDKGNWAFTQSDEWKPPPGFEYMRDLFSLRQGLFADAAPPPPNRRSSLHARTGSAADSSARLPEEPERHHSIEPYGRDTMRTPVPKETTQSAPGSEKRGHYPPIAGQARAGLNRIFRRSSTNGKVDSTQADAEVSMYRSDAEHSQRADHEHSGHTAHGNYVGVPSWASRGIVADERAGCTPPPITLNPRQMRNVVDDMDRPADLPAPTTVPHSPEKVETGRRRWLPFRAGGRRKSQGHAEDTQD